MAFTGLDFKKAWERRVDKSFNDYYPDQTLLGFFVRVLRLGLTEKYKSLDKQLRYDDLRGMIVRDRTISVTSGKVMLQSIAAVGYNSITGVISTAYPHNALIGQSLVVEIVGSSGTISGSFTVTAVPSSTQITIAPQAVGTFVSGYVTTEQTISDYLHLNSLKIEYRRKSNVQILTMVSTPDLIKFSTTTYCKLRSGEKVFIEGVVGATNANGSFYVKQTGVKQYQLFSDKTLETPIVGNNHYVSGGTLYFYETTDYLFQDKPDQILAYDKPTEIFPRWKFSENSIVVEPATYAQNIIFNYLKVPPFVIDPEDDTLDLLLFIPQEMIEFLVDYGAQLFDLETKDWNSLGADSNQVVMNK